MFGLKISIITLHAVKNYGSVLQTFATQELFKLYGCDVEVINFIREDTRDENLIFYWCRNNIIKRIVIFPTIIRWKKVFNSFLKKYINLSSVIYTTDEDFRSFPLTADAYCTGSDQVWNSKWNQGIILPLYLSFVPEDKFKFSFASSFGSDELSDEEVLATKKFIYQYNFISVRENSGKTVIEKQYGYPEATHLVDPTLVMTSDFWRKYATPRKVNDDYILVYNLNRNKDFDTYAIKLAKITGLKLVRFCTRYDQFYRPGKSMLIPEVFDFVSLIDNAKYVLTDSFHAAAFSMNMNTEPICVYPKEFGGRIESFLTLTQSLQRHISDFNDFDVLNRPVNFEKVNRILDGEREKAYNYINKVLAEIKCQKGKVDFEEINNAN